MLYAIVRESTELHYEQHEDADWQMPIVDAITLIDSNGNQDQNLADALAEMRDHPEVEAKRMRVRLEQVEWVKR